jgi:hypothetical protein
LRKGRDRPHAGVQAHEEPGAEREVDRRGLLENASHFTRAQRDAAVLLLDLHAEDALHAEVVGDVGRHGAPLVDERALTRRSP